MSNFCIFFNVAHTESLAYVMHSSYAASSEAQLMSFPLDRLVGSFNHAVLDSELASFRRKWCTRTRTPGYSCNLQFEMNQHHFFKRFPQQNVRIYCLRTCYLPSPSPNYVYIQYIHVYVYIYITASDETY